MYTMFMHRYMWMWMHNYVAVYIYIYIYMSIGSFPDVPCIFESSNLSRDNLSREIGRSDKSDAFQRPGAPPYVLV